MGILNVTPDSFFDGGVYNHSLDSAISRVDKMVKSGASIVDIGGESSRPGSKSVSLDEELSRVVPVVSAIADRFDITISVDTTKSVVAKESISVGANWINDISMGRFDSKLSQVIANSNSTVVLMHSRGVPKSMQDNPHYRDVMDEVISELLVAVEFFKGCGVSEGNIILDPGIGFAKRYEDNINLLRGLDRFSSLGYKTLLGTSRKSFLGEATGRAVKDRVAGSLATVASAYSQGVSLFRVHDVAATVDLLKVLSLIKGDNNG